jgi:thioredoxin-like negative regulator of GroEL
MWLPSVPSLDVASLVTALESHQVVVLHVWAEWNIYDRKYDSQLRQLYNEFKDRIFFAAINCDDQNHFAFLQRSGVANVPALIGLVRGNVAGTIVGCRQNEELREKFIEWIEMANAGTS